MVHVQMFKGYVLCCETWEVIKYKEVWRLIFATAKNATDYVRREVKPAQALKKSQSLFARLRKR
jgi:hypothetical protein